MYLSMGESQNPWCILLDPRQTMEFFHFLISSFSVEMDFFRDSCAILWAGHRQNALKIGKKNNFTREGRDFVEFMQNLVLLCRNWFFRDFCWFFAIFRNCSAFSLTSHLKIDFARLWQIRALRLKPESCVLLRFSDFFQILSSFCSSPTLLKLLFSRFCKIGELHFKSKSCDLLRFSCVWVAFQE